jgi:hypothetical protein
MSSKLGLAPKILKHEFYVIPDLNEPLILGIDFIQKHQLWYCPKNTSFTWEGQPNWGQGHLKLSPATTVTPLSVAFIKATYLRVTCALPMWTAAFTLSSQGALFGAT